MFFTKLIQKSYKRHVQVKAKNNKEREGERERNREIETEGKTWQRKKRREQEIKRQLKRTYVPHLKTNWIFVCNIDISCRYGITNMMYAIEWLVWYGRYMILCYYAIIIIIIITAITYVCMCVCVWVYVGRKTMKILFQTIKSLGICMCVWLGIHR